MRALVIGASGLVGGALLKNLSLSGHDTLGSYNSMKIGNCVKLDITEKENVFDLISNFQPDVVFLPAALANVDFCEENPGLCRKINVEGTRNVAVAAAKLVFFSTEYVFDGKAGPYSEEDEVNPINKYGAAKVEAERIIKSLENSLIIRTTVVYGNEVQGKNFAIKVIQSLRNGAQFRAVTDQISTPTYVDDLAEKTIELTKRDKTGVYNVVGPDLVSRYEFALEIAEAFNLKKSLVKPVSTAELGQKAPRPLNCGLKTDKLSRELGCRTLTVREGLDAFKEAFKNDL